MRRRSAGTGLMAIMLGWQALASGRAAAADDSLPANQFSVQNFHADVGAGSYFVMQDTPTLGQWKFASGLSFSYADKPFYADTDTDEVKQQIVEYMVTLELFSSVGITDFFDVGLSLPINRSAGSLSEKIEEDLQYTPYSCLKPGDIWTTGKLRILDPKKRLLGLALVSELSIPVGNLAGFGRDDGVTLRGRVVTELELKRLRLAAHGGYRLRPSAMVALSYVTDSVEYGAAARVSVVQGIDLVAELIGSFRSPLEADLPTGFSDVDEITSPSPLEALIGVKGSAPGGLMVTVGGGTSFNLDPGAPLIRFFVTLAYRRPAETDIDRDGFPYRLDGCPSVPENVNGVQDDDGCPEADSDGDTLVDPIDACSTAPEDFDGFKDGDGCPDLDNDADGLDDTRDQCPNEPEDKNGVEDGDGCPEVDTDQDGISDRKDRCPAEPEDANGIDDDDGCPEHLAGGRDAAFDTDQDGVEDRADRCALVPENRNGVQDWDGCPETDVDGDGRPDELDRCPEVPEDMDGFEDDDGCPESGGPTGNQPAPKPETGAEEAGKP